MVVKNATPRQGLAARTVTALRRIGFHATNGGNAPTGARTVLAHAPGPATAAGVVAQAVKVGRGVAERPEGGLARTTVVLVLGDDFRGVAARVKKPAPARPPKPTTATRSLPPWDPRPC